MRPDDAPPTPLQALWLRRMREDLPAAARGHPEWPVGADHCFGRVILDAVCGRPWREVVAAPARRHLPSEHLRMAIGLADAILAGDADLAALNRASLRLRCASERGRHLNLCAREGSVSSALPVACARGAASERACRADDLRLGIAWIGPDRPPASRPLRP